VEEVGLTGSGLQVQLDKVSQGVPDEVGFLVEVAVAVVLRQLGVTTSMMPAVIHQVAQEALESHLLLPEHQSLEVAAAAAEYLAWQLAGRAQPVGVLVAAEMETLLLRQVAPVQ
jgi:hypothetical protein